MVPVLEWIDSDSVSKKPEIHSRNLFAQAFADVEPDRLVQKYAHLTLQEMKSLLEYALTALGVSLNGTGIELGVGVGGVSNSLLSLYPAITNLYGIEIVPDVVRLLLTKVTQKERNESRFTPVIGSFDDIHLPDESVDFIVELDALHHSENLHETLKEAARVLKPGGILIAFDRMNSNALSYAQRKYMLSVEYDDDTKKEFGIPLDMRLTRGQNGEHEIRESEWRDAFQQAELSVEQCVTFHKKGFRGFAYGLISQIPFRLREKYTFYPMLVRFPLRFFVFYGFPFVPVLWKNKYRPVQLSFSKRGAFLSRTVFVARKLGKEPIAVTQA